MLLLAESDWEFQNNAWWDMYCCGMRVFCALVKTNIQLRAL